MIGPTPVLCSKDRRSRRRDGLCASIYTTDRRPKQPSHLSPPLPPHAGAMAPSSLRKLNQTVTIPNNTVSGTANSTSPLTPKTPKTPADEGIDFFESAFKQGDEPIQVYELQLDPDGGPNKDRSVAYRFPSPLPIQYAKPGGNASSALQTSYAISLMRIGIWLMHCCSTCVFHQYIFHTSCVSR